MSNAEQENIMDENHIRNTPEETANNFTDQSCKTNKNVIQEEKVKLLHNTTTKETSGENVEDGNMTDETITDHDGKTKEIIVQEEKVKLLHMNKENEISGENAEDGNVADEKITDEEAKTDDTMRNVPVDRGWAWVILGAAFFEVLIFGGMMKSFGIFFIAYQERFKSSASEISMILTITNLTTSFTGIFVMTIGMKYASARTLIVIGAVTISLFYILTAFAENIGIVYLTVGFIQGVSAGMIYLPIVATINIYFDKYRGLANSITMSGSSLGGLVGGPLYSTLFEEYGYMGTLLILSGIMLNIVITGALMRPVEFFSRVKTAEKNRVTRSREEDVAFLSKSEIDKCSNSRKSVNSCSTGADGDVNKHPSIESAYGSEDTDSSEKLSNTVVNKTKKETAAIDDLPANMKTKPRTSDFARFFSRSVSYDPEKLEYRVFPSPSLKRTKHKSLGSHLLKQVNDDSLDMPRKRAFSELDHGKSVHNVVDSISRSQVALYASADVVCGSMANIYSLRADDDVFREHDTNNELPATEVKGSSSVCFSLRRYTVSFLKTVFDVSMLRSSVFLHYLAFAALILPGSIMPTIYFAPYAKEIGLSTTEIGTMFSVIGCLDTVSRIGVGIIADKSWMEGTSIIVLTATIIGTACNLVRFFTTYWTLLIFVIIIGIFCGAYMSLYAIIIMKHMGADKFKGSLGWANMCHGVTMAAFFPLTGYLRDETGTYFATFHLVGVTLYLAAVLSFLLPYTSKRN